jgi:N-acetylglucosaminyl-diphospho-decaprenol L-rhamnosyltransferase
MTTFKDLTISIISHAHNRLLNDLLEDLKCAGALEQCRVIVTINITDPAFPYGKWRSTKIEWIHNEVPKGFGENHNIALAGARTDWVLILNPDIRLPEGALAGMLSTLPDLADIGIVAPRIVSTSGRIEDSVRRHLSPVALFVRSLRRLFGLPANDVQSVEASADWFAGMFLLMPSRVFSAVGGFDERYFLYCEDCDLCIRVSLLGKRLLLDDQHVVVHDAQRSSHRHLRYIRWHLSSLLKLWCSSSWWVYTFRRATRQIGGIDRLKAPPCLAHLRADRHNEKKTPA